jgi:cytochrome c
MGSALWCAAHYPGARAEQSAGTGKLEGSMSDSLAVNKVMASVLVCGIVFMVSGLIADALVKPARLAQSAIKIDVAAAPVAVADSGEAPLPPIAPLLAKADPVEGGKEMAKVCSVCHDWTQGGPAKVGPNLYNVVGGPHAHMVGFNYSDGLKAIKGPWTFDELNAWLRNPRDVVPGTRMSFAGLDSDQERADVIDYLHTLSPNPEPLPPVNAGSDATKPAAPAAPTAGVKAGNAGPTDQRTETEKAANSTTNSLAPQAGTPSGNPAGH